MKNKISMLKVSSDILLWLFKTLNIPKYTSASVFKIYEKYLRRSSTLAKLQLEACNFNEKLNFFAGIF